MATTSRIVKIRTVVIITTLLFMFILFSPHRQSTLPSATDAIVEQMDYQQIGISSCPPDPQREDERPPIIVRSTDVSTIETPPVNAAIIFLIEFLDRPLAQNHKEMMRFNQSLWSLWNNFNEEYRYPIHIFYEWPFNSTYRDEYRAMWPKEMNVTFHLVEFKLPATFPQIDVNDPAQIDSLNMNPTARRAFPGYNHMIHFFMVDIFQHPAVKDLEYFWRLDHDSRLDSKIGVDVFRYMRARGMDYGFRVVGQEARHVAKGMLDFFNDYLHNSSNKAVDGISAYDEAHRNCLAIPQDYSVRKETAPLLYYNNFEIVNVQTWQSPEIQALTKAIDDTNMIYWNRWGDAPLRYYTVNMLLSVKAKVMEWCHIDYFHHKNYRPSCRLEL